LLFSFSGTVHVALGVAIGRALADFSPAVKIEQEQMEKENACFFFDKPVYLSYGAQWH